MQLLNKTDFKVLNELMDGKRNNSANLAIILNIDRPYLNTRMRVLDDYGLVKRIGPAERSGLYEITPKGQLVVEHEEVFHDPQVDFSTYIKEQF